MVLIQSASLFGLEVKKTKRRSFHVCVDKPEPWIFHIQTAKSQLYNCCRLFNDEQLCNQSPVLYSHDKVVILEHFSWHTYIHISSSQEYWDREKEHCLKMSKYISNSQILRKYKRTILMTTDRNFHFADCVFNHKPVA